MQLPQGFLNSLPKKGGGFFLYVNLQLLSPKHPESLLNQVFSPFIEDFLEYIVPGKGFQYRSYFPGHKPDKSTNKH